MKNILFLFVTIFSLSLSINAQKPRKKESRNKQIKALKVAFLTEELNLTSYEAEKFWPVYNKFDSLLHQLERVEKYKLMSKVKEVGGFDNLSENDAKTIVDKNSDLDNKVFKVKREFNLALTKVLSHKKILKLKNAEREFIRNLMRKYRNKRSRKNKK